MAKRNRLGAAARTSGSRRILCQHGNVYPCSACKLLDPEYEAKQAAFVAGVEQECKLAGARVAAQNLRNKMVAGDWIGCFECKALDSIHIGVRMLLVFGGEAFAGYLLGMQAPDTSTFGPGWKFRLDAKATSPDDAAAWLYRVGDYR